MTYEDRIVMAMARSQGVEQEDVVTLLVGERRSGRVRALTKVPVCQGSEVTYIETGVKCDAEYQVVEGGIQLEVETHFSEVASTPEQGGTDLPLIYEWQSQVQKTVPSNEKTVLSSYNDEHSNRRYELEVIAERLP